MYIINDMNFKSRIMIMILIMIKSMCMNKNMTL